jgi:hypothetical protein
MNSETKFSIFMGTVLMLGTLMQQRRQQVVNNANCLSNLLDRKYDAINEILFSDLQLLYLLKNKSVNICDPSSQEQYDKCVIDMIKD